MVNPLTGLRAIVRDIGEHGRTMLGALFSGGRNTSADRDAKSILQNQRNQPWLTALTWRIARTAASQEWELYRSARGPAARTAAKSFEARQRDYRAKTGSATEWQPVEQHPVLDFLNNGNAELSGHQVQSLTYQYLDLTGDCFWLIERGPGGQPVAPWPVPAHWIEQIAVPDNPYFKVTVNGWSDAIPASDVIYFRVPAALNPYGRGLGVAVTLADELETDEYAARHISSFFKNRARPDFLVMGKLSPTDTKRLEREWVAESRGFWNAFKPRFLSGTDFKIHEMSQSFQSMEFTALRKFGRDYLAQVLGVPLEIMGIVENSNRSTIDVADYLFMRHTIVPRLELVRSTLQKTLVAAMDPTLSLEYRDPVPEDRTAILDSMGRAPWAYTVDEWRATAEHDPLADEAGRVFMIPANLYAVATPADMQAEPEPSTPAGAVQEAAPEIVIIERAPAPVPSVRREAVLSLTPEEIDDVAASVDPATLGAEIRPAITETVARFGQHAIEEMGFSLDFNLSDPNVTAFLRDTAGDRIKDLYNETTRQALRDTLAEGVSGGETMAELQERIVGEFDAARGYRSHNIARTETNRAANFGAMEGYRDAGIKRTQWLATRGGQNRDTHAPGAGLDQQIREIGTKFQSPGGGTAMYPGGFGIAAEDCQCQCRVVGYLGKATTEAQRKALWADFQRQQAGHVRTLRAGLRRGFDKQQRAALAELRRVAER